jgi:predicted N-acyltransferase
MQAQVYGSIHEVPEALWDGLATQHSQAMSRAFWQVLERAELNDFRYYYAVFTNDAGEAQAITSFYTISTDIAIFAPAPLRAALGAVRRFWPGFLKLKMLECGTPITIVSPPFVKRPEVPDEALVAALTRLLRRVAREKRQFLIVVRDFEPNASHYEPLFGRHGYHMIDSLPNTYLTVRWATPKAYLDAMRSYYRSKLLKYLKLNQAAGISHRLVEDFADMAETLHGQWMTVHENAREFQREVLTPEFYRQFSRGMGSDSKVLLFYRGEELTGHALLLLDGEELRWLYVGRKTAENDGLYLYVAQKVVETAIELGVSKLEMGLTTYPIKQDLGAEVVPIRIALRATWGIINPFVGLGYKVLNSVPTPGKRQIFKPAGERG